MATLRGGAESNDIPGFFDTLIYGINTPEGRARARQRALRGGAPVPTAPAAPQGGGASGSWGAPTPAAPTAPRPGASAVDNGFRVGANEGPSVKAAVAAPGSMGANVGARDREIAALEQDLAVGRVPQELVPEARATVAAYRQQVASGQAIEDAPGWKDRGASQPVERGGQPNPAVRAGNPTASGFAGGPGTGATATVNGGSVLPKAIDWNARRDALAEQYGKVNAPPDMQSLTDEGKRRGTEGMGNLMLALAAQNAGKENEPFAGAFLKRAMAMQDPLKFSGGQVDEYGNVVMDPGYKREQQLAHLDRLAKMDTEGQMSEQKMANDQLLARIAGSNQVAAAEARSSGMPGRQISDAGVKDIAGFETSKAQLDALHASFKPEYARVIAGFGPIENWGGDVFGTPAGMWWKKVMANQNQVLKDLSGSAVTAPEAARFRAAFVNSNMPAATIPQQLREQAAAAQAARDKLIQVYGQSGRNVSGFDAQPQQGGAPTGAAPAPSGGGREISWGAL